VYITDYFQFIFSMLPPDFSNQPTYSKQLFYFQLMVNSINMTKKITKIRPLAKKCCQCHSPDECLDTTKLNSQWWFENPPGDRLILLRYSTRPKHLQIKNRLFPLPYCFPTSPRHTHGPSGHFYFSLYDPDNKTMSAQVSCQSSQ
jgi:hypothetical protein